MRSESATIASNSVSPTDTTSLSPVRQLLTSGPNSSVAKRTRASIPSQSARTPSNAFNLRATDPSAMAIGAPAEPRTAVVPNGTSNSNQSVDLLDSSAPARANDDAKQPLGSVNALKENGTLHNHNVSVHGHGRVVGVHRFSNQEVAESSTESAPTANERPPEAAATPIDANGHSLPPHHLRNAQHPLMHQHHLQQQQQHPHAGVIGLANAFEGLSVGPPPHPPGAHPHLMHHPHHQAPPPHPLAHHPHAHPPGMGPGPPPGMQPHPHPHPHMLSGPPGSQQMPPPHHISQSPPPHLIPRHPQPTTMEMWVPQDRVGAVIGSQGAVIKALQDRSRATIQVHNETIRGDRKLFTIVGGPAECQVARQLVMEIIERPRTNHSHAAPSGVANSGNGPHSPGTLRGDRGNFHQQEGGSGDRGGMMSKTVFVPTSCVGLVIGRKGETIRELQTKSGAQIFVTRDRDATQGSHDRSVQISGTEQAIHTATKLVRDIVHDAQSRRQNQVQNHSRMPPAHSGPMLMETLTVPDDKVGLIIGKGGAAIRELQSVSGAKIQVAKEDEASTNNNTRPVTLTGVRSCIDAAKTLIAEKVNMHLPPASAMQTYSPQQPAFIPPNAGIYYPVYEAGFAHPMQPGPYQQIPPPPFDPNDPQQAQLRAFAYYHQFHHPGYYHAQQQLHQQMQQQHHQQRQANVEGQEQHGGEQPTELGEHQAAASEGIAPSEAGTQNQKDTLSPTIHRNQPQVQFGIQDQPIALNNMGGAQSQGISHFARQTMNMLPQQNIPPRRIMAQPHFMAAAQHHPRVHHDQIQAHMANLQQMAHFAANAQQQQQQRANGAAAAASSSSANNVSQEEGAAKVVQQAPPSVASSGHELTQRGGKGGTDEVKQQKKLG